MCRNTCLIILGLWLLQDARRVGSVGRCLKKCLVGNSCLIVQQSNDIHTLPSTKRLEILPVRCLPCANADGDIRASGSAQEVSPHTCDTRTM